MRLVLRGASLVDGTGSRARAADVAVVDGRVSEVGRIARGGNDEDVDLSGLVLSPGFIDPHTHYDAQVFWDPDVTPSSWHGVTTVVLGNCGFTVAPNRVDCRDQLLEMLTNVEGMSYDALTAGIPWDFSTYPEYLHALDARPLRVNVASMVGHSAVRYFVMGHAATERQATAEELMAMRRVVSEALAAGAVGFSTSRSTSHIGAGSKPVPSRVGDYGEIWHLAEALRERGTGILEATWGPDLFVDEFAQLAAHLQRPVTWAAVLTQRGAPEWTTDIMERTEQLGGDVHPQMACKPLTLQIDLSKPGTMAVIPSFAAALSKPLEERLALFASPQWRLGAASEVAGNAAWTERLERATVQASSAHPELVGGEPLGVIAQDRRCSSLDLLLDLVAADRLQTRFSVSVMNEAEDEIVQMLANKRLLLGLSDAGAHANQLCDANAPTYLLGHWWRERRAISLEEAVWRLSAHPARVFGLAERGSVVPGFVADLVAFDPETVGSCQLERWQDFPANSERLVVGSRGIEHVWVRGRLTRKDGQPVPGAYPGSVLRGGCG